MVMSSPELRTPSKQRHRTTLNKHNAAIKLDDRMSPGAYLRKNGAIIIDDNDSEDEQTVDDADELSPKIVQQVHERIRGENQNQDQQLADTNIRNDDDSDSSGICQQKQSIFTRRYRVWLFVIFLSFVLMFVTNIPNSLISLSKNTSEIASNLSHCQRQLDGLPMPIKHIDACISELEYTLTLDRHHQSLFNAQQRVDEVETQIKRKSIGLNSGNSALKQFKHIQLLAEQLSMSMKQHEILHNDVKQNIITYLLESKNYADTNKDLDRDRSALASSVESIRTLLTKLNSSLKHSQSSEEKLLQSQSEFNRCTNNIRLCEDSLISHRQLVEQAEQDMIVVNTDIVDEQDLVSLSSTRVLTHIANVSDAMPRINELTHNIETTRNQRRQERNKHLKLQKVLNDHEQQTSTMSFFDEELHQVFIDGSHFSSSNIASSVFSRDVTVSELIQSEEETVERLRNEMSAIDVNTVGISLHRRRLSMELVQAQRRAEVLRFVADELEITTLPDDPASVYDSVVAKVADMKALKHTASSNVKQSVSLLAKYDAKIEALEQDLTRQQRLLQNSEDTQNELELVADKHQKQLDVLQSKLIVVQERVDALKIAMEEKNAKLQSEKKQQQKSVVLMREFKSMLEKANEESQAVNISLQRSLNALSTPIENLIRIRRLDDELTQSMSKLSACDEATAELTDELNAGVNAWRDAALNEQQAVLSPPHDDDDDDDDDEARIESQPEINSFINHSQQMNNEHLNQ